jgi:hypothetical protein
VLWNPSLLMQDGDVDVDLRGRDVLQRSFVGIACRIAEDGAAQVIWLRPFNFRSADPARRSRSLQLAAHPEYPRGRLRRENPGGFSPWVGSDSNGDFKNLRVLRLD